MKNLGKNIIGLLLIITFLVACNSKPKVIQSESQTATADVAPNSIPAFDEVPPVKDSKSEEHKVVVEEVLSTTKYSYLNVSEAGEKFWIAIAKRDVNLGDTYYYKGGLLKRNFYSKEFNRTFETVYLVSNIWKKPDGSALEEAVAQQAGHSPNLDVGTIEPVEGSIKLSELFANKSNYNGKVVKVTGKIVKVNPMIMNRNWLHLQDGSGDDLDLTITTSENVPLGAVVSIEGTITLDKDFGAGYRYDIIMEDAVLK